MADALGCVKGAVEVCGDGDDESKGRMSASLKQLKFNIRVIAPALVTFDLENSSSLAE